MARSRSLKGDIGRVIATGATLILVAYLFDCFITAAAEGDSVFSQIISPGYGELTVRLMYLSVLVLFILYVSGILAKRTHIEEALLKYQAGMDASIDGVFILNNRLECSYLNSSHARLHGYDSYADLLGKSWRIFYGEDEVRRLELEALPLLGAKGEWRGEAIGRRKDGSTFPQEISVTAIDQGGIVGIVRDISEHKRFERELECKAKELAAANRELEAFSYSLTHDIRTHITRTYTAAQILRDDFHAVLDKNGSYLVEVLCDASKDMEKLIKDMMVLSRIIRTEISRQMVDLSNLSLSIASVLEQTEPDRRVSFTIAADLVAEGDPHLLHVALDNLIRNAWKYTVMTSDALIEIGVVARAGRRAFFVRDNGIGFDMKDADKLFKPFQRLQNAKSFPGTGIGLATVQRIIQRHGGEAWCEGELGKGATFFFMLPA